MLGRAFKGHARSVYSSNWPGPQGSFAGRAAKASARDTPTTSAEPFHLTGSSWTTASSPVVRRNGFRDRTTEEKDKDDDEDDGAVAVRSSDVEALDVVATGDAVTRRKRRLGEASASVR